jgi:hypothetical protein
MNVVKAAIANAIFLNLPPGPNIKIIHIYTDASDHGIGAAIGYFDENNEFRLLTSALASTSNMKRAILSPKRTSSNQLCLSVLGFTPSLDGMSRSTLTMQLSHLIFASHRQSTEPTLFGGPIFPL